MDPASLGQFVRAEHGRLVAALMRVCGGDLALAEDCLSAAVQAALETWPTQGAPDAPERWLLAVARNRAWDQLRRSRVWAHKQRVLQQDSDGEAPMAELRALPDDRLRLVCTLCHPAIAPASQVALTLRAVCGLTTEEIARAFLVDPATMAQRLVRAQRKIRDAGVPYEVPDADALPERLAGVMGVVYLVFNEGYVATRGPALQRVDLCAEALRLGGLLAALAPDTAEVHGLNALMLFHHSRRHTRVDPHGALVRLEDQDRARWDNVHLRAGFGALREAIRRGGAGRYTLQAGILSVHAAAARAEDTDWPQIVALYDRLMRLVPSAVVSLNRAVAVGMAEGPEVGLRTLDAAPFEHHLWHAARADFLARLGQSREAALAFRAALGTVENDVERAFLARRLVEIEGS